MKDFALTLTNERFLKGSGHEKVVDLGQHIGEVADLRLPGFHKKNKSEHTLLRPSHHEYWY